MTEVFRDKLGFKDYVVTMPEDEKVVEGWRTQIEQITGWLQSGKDGRSRLEDYILEKGRHKKAPADFFAMMDVVYQQFDQGGLSAQGKQLLAISLWLMREKGIWRPLGSSMKVVKGGEYPLDAVIEKDGKPNCIDTSVMTKEIARTYGINGDTKTVNEKNKHDHYFFASEEGNIVDVWRLKKRGGFAKNREEFDKYREGLFG